MFGTIFIAKRYDESWTEGVSVYQNPDALHPLDRDLFPYAVRHFQRPGGHFRSFTQDFYLVRSAKWHFASVGVAEALAGAEAMHAMGAFCLKEQRQSVISCELTASFGIATGPPERLKLGRKAAVVAITYLG